MPLERLARLRSVGKMSSRHHVFSLAAAAVTALVLAGCGSDDNSTGTAQASKPASSGSGDAVTISDFKFAPASLTVDKGARVTVTNDDSTTHTATADDGAFDTGNIDPGSSKTIALSKPGSYAYHCAIHPFMHGTVVLK
jgi:plastocyanin